MQREVAGFSTRPEGRGKVNREDLIGPTGCGRSEDPDALQIGGFVGFELSEGTGQSQCRAGRNLHGTGNLAEKYHGSGQGGFQGVNPDSLRPENGFATLHDAHLQYLQRGIS